MNIFIANNVILNKEQKKRINKLGRIKYFKPNNNLKNLKKLIENCEILFVWHSLNKDLIKKLKKCKLIIVWATGTDYINVEDATKKRIKVANVPTYATDAVAEHVFALMLGIIKNLKNCDDNTKKGDWRKNINLLSELKNKTLGIVGLGDIGKRVAEIANAFEMKVIAFTRHPSKTKKIKFVQLNNLFKNSDFISLHVPYTKITHHLINKESLKLMKKTAIIINASRGKVIDQKSLIQALKNKVISFAGLDVFYDEPIDKNNKLLKLKSVLLTPHVAFYTQEAIKTLSDVAIENIESFINGKLKNIVN